MRWPMPSMRPSFFMSRWIISLVAFVADDLWLGFEGAQLAEADPAQDGADGGSGHVELPGDGGSTQSAGDGVARSR